MDGENIIIQTGTNDLMKSINEDERLFTAIVLRPNVVDAHGDIYDEDVVKQACHDYVAHCMNTNLQHSMDLEKAHMSIVESWVAPCDLKINNQDVYKGDWVITAKIHNDALWEECKKGTFTGFSVGVSALTEVLDDET